MIGPYVDGELGYLEAPWGDDGFRLFPKVGANIMLVFNRILLGVGCEGMVPFSYSFSDLFDNDTQQGTTSVIAMPIAVGASVRQNERDHVYARIAVGPSWRQWNETDTNKTSCGLDLLGPCPPPTTSISSRSISTVNLLFRVGTIFEYGVSDTMGLQFGSNLNLEFSAAYSLGITFGFVYYLLDEEPQPFDAIAPAAPKAF